MKQNPILLLVVIGTVLQLFKMATAVPVDYHDSLLKL